MKRHFFGATILAAAIVFSAPNHKADSRERIDPPPDDQTVALDLKFTKKKPNAAQRIFSFLDFGPNGFATGFVVGDGLVITAYHVVSGNLSVAKKVQLGFSPKDELEVKVYVKGCQAKVLKVDPNADLALLRTCQSRKDTKAPSFQATLIKEEKLLVIARPHGSKLIRKGVFYGPYVVGGQEYNLAKIDGRDGYSGSPVYNEKAEIVGVFSGYDRTQNLAVISPGGKAQKLLEDYNAEPKH
jgi:S1-C subfamily serine protease